MILKENKTNFTIEINKTNKSEGLAKGDKWCHVTCHINNSKFNITLDDNILSTQEIEQLINELNDFINNKNHKKKRISFIKNFIIIYLSTINHSQKIAKIKFVHLGAKKENYIIQLEENEIKELINILNKKD